MDSVLLVQSLIQLGISIIAGILIFLFSFKMFTLLTRDIDEIAEIKKKNIAVSVLVTIFVFSIMIIIKAAIEPAIDSLHFAFAGKVIIPLIVIISIIRVILFFVITALFAFIILWFAIKLFMILTTDIDEMDEIKNGNLSIAIVIGSLMLGVALLLSKPLSTILDGLVTEPTITRAAKIQINFVNMTVFTEGLIQLGIAIIGTVFTFFISFKVFSLLTKNIDETAELKQNNIAVGILLSAFVFGILFLVHSALEPANQALKQVLQADILKVGHLFLAIGQVVLFFIAAAIIGFIFLWVGMKCFMLLTVNIDEMGEIKAGNIAVAIIIAILIITIALLIQEGLAGVLQSFVKMPKVDSGIVEPLAF